MTRQTDGRDLIEEFAFVARLHSDSDSDFARRIATCVELIEVCADDGPKEAIRAALDLYMDRTK